MPFIDTHVHLHFPEYDKDREAVIEASRKAGVETFVNVGTGVESSRKSLQLAKDHASLYATAGIHPHDAKDATPEDFAAIAELLKEPKMVAVGEVGLDFYRGHSPREKQEQIFREFLRLHHALKKPLVIHCRDAYEEMLAVIKSEIPPPYDGVMHCFSSDKDTMKKFLDLGFFISFAGPLTYKKNDGLREACRACPKDRLVLETDAPFLPPQSRRGTRNESAFLVETAQAASELQGVPLERLGEITTANAKRLFRLAQGPGPAAPAGRE